MFLLHNSLITVLLLGSSGATVTRHTFSKVPYILITDWNP